MSKMEKRRSGGESDDVRVEGMGWRGAIGREEAGWRV